MARVNAAFALILLLAVAIGAALYLRRRRRVAAALGDPELLGRLLGEDLRLVPRRRMLLLLAAAAALALALLDPRWGRASTGWALTRGPVVLVLDVSNSMLVEDIAPSRLEWARQMTTSLVDELEDRPVGIVVFAGRAYALTPPTRDVGAIDLFLKAIDTRMVTQTGSALAGAVRQGVGLLLAGEGGEAGTVEGGSLVVLSDGDARDEGSDLIEALSLARRAGIAVHAVGVGTEAGGPVPELDPLTGERRGYIREESGAPVVSRLAENSLRDVASETGGSFYLASEASAPRLARALAESGRGGSGGGEEEGAPRYAWFAALALGLLVAERVVARRRSPTPAVVGMIVLMGAAACSPSAAPPEGASADSVAYFRALVEANPDDPIRHYGLGTVLLTRRRFEEARPPLERAAEAREAEVSQHAHYNLGNTRLEPAWAEPSSADAAEREKSAAELRLAAESYREALRRDPSDLDAKWNLELTDRRLRQERTPPPPPPPQAEGEGGGGGGGGGAGGGTAAPGQGRGSGSSPSMTREQAEALLAAARNREVGVQRETLQKPQGQGGNAH